MNRWASTCRPVMLVLMNRTEISEIAHRRHPLAAPVAAEQAQLLLSWLSPPPGGRAVDLGCGYGVWLLELVEQHSDLNAVGVDVALPTANQQRAQERGLEGRLQWAEADAASWHDGLFDVVLCVGASHAFGGLAGTLAALRRHLRPGGQALLGDTFWEAPPSRTAQQVLRAGPDDFPDLTGVLDSVREYGFEPGYGHISTLQEWDEYEWAWIGSLTHWALREAPDHEERQQALDAAREHRRAWLHGYRGQLGFATLVLHDIQE